MKDTQTGFAGASLHRDIKGITMIGFYNYTVVLTYAGFACGCCGIYYALSGHPGIGIILLLLAGFCDMFDGKVARTRERTDAEKQFGIQIDSLSDLVCFGLLPAVIGYACGLNRPLDLVILVFSGVTKPIFHAVIFCQGMVMGSFPAKISASQVSKSRRFRKRSSSPSLTIYT